MSIDRERLKQVSAQIEEARRKLNELFGRATPCSFLLLAAEDEIKHWVKNENAKDVGPFIALANTYVSLLAEARKEAENYETLEANVATSFATASVYLFKAAAELPALVDSIKIRREAVAEKGSRRRNQAEVEGLKNILSRIQQARREIDEMFGQPVTPSYLLITVEDEIRVILQCGEVREISPFILIAETYAALLVAIKDESSDFKSVLVKAQKALFRGSLYLRKAAEQLPALVDALTILDDLEDEEK